MQQADRRADASLVLTDDLQELVIHVPLKVVVASVRLLLSLSEDAPRHIVGKNKCAHILNMSSFIAELSMVRVDLSGYSEVTRDREVVVVYAADV